MDDDRSDAERAAYREKLLSIGTGLRHGESRTRTVASETSNRIAGTVTDHWDGRNDAAVFPESFKIKRGGRIQ